jgi:hypothetical protein
MRPGADRYNPDDTADPPTSSAGSGFAEAYRVRSECGYVDSGRIAGAAPTFRRAEVLAIAVVGFDRARIRSQRVLWDQATLAAQLGLNPATVPAASGPAR